LNSAVSTERRITPALRQELLSGLEAGSSVKDIRTAEGAPK